MIGRGLIGRLIMGCGESLGARPLTRAGALAPSGGAALRRELALSPPRRAAAERVSATARGT